MARNPSIGEAYHPLTPFHLQEHDADAARPPVQVPVLGSRSPLLGPRSSVLGPRSPVPGPWSSVPGPQSQASHASELGARQQLGEYVYRCWSGAVRSLPVIRTLDVPHEPDGSLVIVDDRADRSSRKTKRFTPSDTHTDIQIHTHTRTHTHTHTPEMGCLSMN